MHPVYQVIFLNKILTNHLLSENMRWNYTSFNVTLNYLMHEIMKFCVTSSLALDNWEQNIIKLLAISQTIHTVCCEDDYFPKGKFKSFNTFFHSVYLVLSKCFVSLFLLPIGLPCVICWSYVTKINAVLWHSARQKFTSLGLFTFARIACLLQLWIKTSELDDSIWATPK